MTAFLLRDPGEEEESVVPILRGVSHAAAFGVALVAATLLGAGALLYGVGAGVYAFKRPDPWPSIFGFHEIFHSLVILAAASHFAAIAGWIVPAAA